MGVLIKFLAAQIQLFLYFLLETKLLDFGEVACYYDGTDAQCCLVLWHVGTLLGLDV